MMYRRFNYTLAIAGVGALVGARGSRVAHLVSSGASVAVDSTNALRGPSRSLADLPGPRGLPGLGNALSIRPSSVHLTAERWCRHYGPVYRVSVGPRTVVVVGDPNLINAILRDRPEGFRRARELAALMDEIGIKGSSAPRVMLGAGSVDRP